ncbi:SDR family oxidoreductase [Paenibacillus sp. sgz500958]|uniref:SDR family oxidoreductase n=1 Tax=Paenibacillus sp. sgz500958 TaxID=3242475 RepID=UPI0036D21222
MRVFVTGATGFIGSAIVRELLDAGHQVLGLARSDKAAAALTAVGAEVHRGSLDDLDSLRSGASAADGVIHTAYTIISDTTDYAASSQADARAIEAMGEALEGTNRPFVVTSVTSLLASDGSQISTEDTPISKAHFRAVGEEMALSFAARGVRVSVIRLPSSVHDADDTGFVPSLISIARSKGVSAYVGDGTNRWPAVHRLDAANLYRLALEAAPAGAKLHAVSDEGIAIRDIAEVIGRNLSLPMLSITLQEAGGHFAWLSRFVALDHPASSALTRQQLGWHPVHPLLIADMERVYFAN